MKRYLIILFFILLFSGIQSQERFSTNYSEKGYLLNPAFAGMLKQNRVSVSSSIQGYSQSNFKNFQAAGSIYSDILNGGIEGYTTINIDGVIRHSIIAAQFSKFTHITGKWSFSLGVAPELHNWSVKNNDLLLESNIIGITGSSTIFPSKWGFSLSVGGAFFTQTQVLGFAVQNIFNKISFVEGINSRNNLCYVGSYGAIFDLNPFSSINSKNFFRPHVVLVKNSMDYSLIYGGYYGRHQSQFGMFFVSSPKSLFLGISPAYMFKKRGLRVVMSVKFFPKLPSLYMFGNEIIMSLI